MQFVYSPQADALSVELVPRGRSTRTVRLGPAVAVDFDRVGRLVSVEILEASAYYPVGKLRTLASPVALLTLAEAAADPECDLKPTTLRNLIRTGRLPAVKKGNRWFLARHELWAYLENRRPRGRPPKGDQEGH